MTTYEADFTTEQRTIKDFLNKIEPAIVNIGGGCSCCINDFLYLVNETLSDYGLRVEYDNNDKINVIETKLTL